jgi:type IX secretion system PorP/SprF family membrane protein
MRSFLYVLIGFFLVIDFASGQDIHWSQFNDNQLFQNPAHSGHFDGDYRFIGNYRDQWRSVTVPFSTTAISVDSKFKNIGFGINMFNDQAGDGRFRTVEVQGNLSYAVKLTRDSSHVFRPGINFGLNHRQINWDALYFDTQYTGYVFNPGAPNFENYQDDRKTNASLGTGFLYEYRKNDRFKILFGSSLFNLNRPNQGFYNTEVKRAIRSNSFVKGTFEVNEKWDVIPSIQFSTQDVYSSLVLGASGKYYLNHPKKKYAAIYGGVWYRNKDAANLSFGYDFADLFVGISYDINFSKLVPASQARGGIEFAVRYIIKKFKPKKVLHKVCPDYI